MAASKTYHRPVLLPETVNLFSPAIGKTYLDATLGNGGHSLALLQAGATVFGLEADPENLKIATDRLKTFPQFHPLPGNFKDVKKIFEDNINLPLDGILFDLGLSQNQTLASNRGFSLNDNQSIDMRLNPKTQKISAEEIINTWDFGKLHQIFTKHSQEKYATPIIIEIIKNRQKSPIKTGQQLAKIIEDLFRARHFSSKIHPATKIFLALKIEVNQESQNLKAALAQTCQILPPKSLTAVISFHSTEDRIVKLFIKSHRFESGKILPSFDETRQNPLCRSAVLRWYRI